MHRTLGWLVAGALALGAGSAAADPAAYGLLAAPTAPGAVRSQPLTLTTIRVGSTWPTIVFPSL